jgi:hypothetical protein
MKIPNIKRMKPCLLLIFISLACNLSAQLACDNLPHDYTGSCDDFNRSTGIRSSWNYKKGVLDGGFQQSYMDGQLRCNGKFKSGLLHGKFNAYFGSGEMMTNAKFKSGSGDFIMHHKNGERKMVGKFIDALPNGPWISYDEKGNIIDTLQSEEFPRHSMMSHLTGDVDLQSLESDFFARMFDSESMFGGDIDSMFIKMQQRMDEVFQRMQEEFQTIGQQGFDTTIHFNFSDSTGSFQHFEFYDGTENARLNENANGLVDFPDVEPRFQGGEKERDLYIRDNMKIDPSVDETIFVEIIVNVEGKLEYVAIALGGERDNEMEALRIVKGMPRWIPAKHNGIVVKSKTIVAVSFSLRG